MTISDRRMDYDRNDEDERIRDDRSSDMAFTLIKIIVGAVVLPAVVYGSIFYYVLLRKLKQRLSVTLIISALSILILYGVWTLDPVGETFIGTFESFSHLKENWKDLIPGFIVIQLALGTLFGLLIIAVSIYQMKANPHRLKIEGNWMYQFVFNRTPWEYFMRKKKIKALKEGELSDEKRSPIGLDENDKRDTVAYRYVEESVQHTIITGAAGSGKTVTELSLMLSDIKMGRSFTVIDFKKSPEFSSKLAAWCKKYDRNFYHFVNGKKEKYNVPNSLGQCAYDPLATASPTARADMILGMREYDQASEVYKNYMVQLLQVIFNALDQADRKKYKESLGETILDAKEKSSHSNKVPRIQWDNGGIYQLASVISSKTTLDNLADACIGTPIEDDIREVAESFGATKGLGNALNELRGQMRTITASEYGKWLKTGGDEERSINLTELMKEEGNVILFSINSDTEPAFAKYVGTLIFADLNSVSTNLRESGSKDVRSIYVDEFQAVHPTTVKSLLEKARESRLAVTLAQQSLDQVSSSVDKNGESYLNAILDTCSNFIVHAGSTERSATRMSQIIGKDRVTKYTQSNTNDSFLFSFNFFNRRKQVIQTSREEIPIAPPRMFMDLSMPSPENNFRTTAVLVNKNSFDPLFKGQPGGKAREVWMIPDDQVIAKYFIPKEDEEEETYRVEEEIFDEDEPQVEGDSHSYIDEDLSDEEDEYDDFYDDGEDFTIEEIPEEEEPDEDSMGMSFFKDDDSEDLEAKKLLEERERKRKKSRMNAERASKSSQEAVSRSDESNRKPIQGTGLRSRKKYPG